MLKKLAVLLIAPLLFSQTAFGAGFALYEFSARGTAMGGATMANKAEAASLAVNPALITELEGTQVQAGLTAVTADATTTVAGQSRSLKDDLWLLPNFFITHKVSDDISFGLGAFSRYGLGGEYKNYQNWIGSGLAYKVKVETFSFTPTIAVKANDEFSFAMGLEAMTISYEQDSLLAVPGVGLLPSYKYEMSGSGISWGGNFSMLYKPEWADKWALGAMYRSKVKQNLDGRLRTNWPGAMGTLKDADAKGSISLPDSLSAGISFTPTDKLTFEAGIIGTFWSAYDQIVIEYKDDEAAPSIHNKKDYKDVIRLNFGTEYQINKNWSVRAGYVYDQSPINPKEMDTLVPVDDRHIASVGAGYQTDTWSVDASYSHVFGRSMKGTSNTQSGSLPMRYSDGKSDMYGLTFGYKF